MNDIKDYEQSYMEIKSYGEKFHEKNQRRIRIGIWCVILIPLVFLSLMFKVGSSKIVYLVLWIVSMFGICGYLFTVEYLDYSMQEKLRELGLSDEEETKNLLGNEEIEKRIEALVFREEDFDEEDFNEEDDLDKQGVPQDKITYFDYWTQIRENDECMEEDYE